MVHVFQTGNGRGRKISLEANLCGDVSLCVWEKIWYTEKSSSYRKKNVFLPYKKHINLFSIENVIIIL